MYSNQVQSGLWPDVNTEYAWKKKYTECRRWPPDLAGPTMQVPLWLFEDKNASPGLIYQLRRRPPTFPGLTRPYVSLRHRLPTPSAAASSLLLGLPLTLSLPLLSGGRKGVAEGLPPPAVRLCPIHPSLPSSTFIITLLPSSCGVTGVSGLTEMLCTCPSASQGRIAV